MRLLCLAALAAAAMFAAPTSTWSADIKILYGVPPVVPVAPPTGYLLDPSDQINQIYVVNQGPNFSGPGIYDFGDFYAPITYPPVTYPPITALPTYSEGGYVYVQPYYLYETPYPCDTSSPYVSGRFDCHGGSERCIGRRGYRPYGVGPYAAYRYQPAPSAHVIEIPGEQ